MKRILWWSVAAFLTGALLAAAAGSLLLRQDPARVLSATGAKWRQTQAAASGPQLSTEEQHQLDFSLSFGAIISDLQPKQGFDLDHYALLDLTAIDQNTIGLLRKVGADAEHPLLKRLATEMQAQREKELERLLALQRASGHTHH